MDNVSPHHACSGEFNRFEVIKIIKGPPVNRRPLKFAGYLSLGLIFLLAPNDLVEVDGLPETLHVISPAAGEFE